MGPEGSAYIVVVILIYLLGALTLASWGYLMTKIVFSIISKERIVLRIIVWPILGWFLALAFYLAFVIGIGLLGAAIDFLPELDH